MAQLVINVGSSPNDGQGDPIRTSFIKCNTNFSELYSRVQTSPPPTLVGSPGDVPGMYAYDDSYFYYCFADYDGSSEIWGQVSSESPTLLANGTSNVIVANSGPITMSVAGTSNVVTVSAAGIDSSNITLTGSLSAVNVSTSGNLSVTGTSNFTGNITSRHLLPAANVTYDLGSPTAQWRDLYVGGNTIYLGDATLSADASSITLTTGSGAEFVIGGAGGNAEGTFGNLDVSGETTTDSLTVISDAAVTGNVTAGYFLGDGSFLTNITAFSNVAATQIANGTSIIDIAGTNGYARVQVGGVANVGVFTPTGLYVSGLLDVTGAFTAGSIGATSALTAIGNVTGGNLTTAGTVSGATITATGTTAATSTITGSLRTAGGLGVAGNAYVGGIISATGNIAGANLTTTGAITATGNISGGNVSATSFIATNGFSGANLTVSTLANITATTAATSTTTGSLRTAGGLGVGGNAFIGGIANVTGNVNSANLNVDNKINVAFVDVVSRINVAASAESTSTTTGAVVVTGGIGAGGNITVGEQIVATGNITGGNLITAGQVSATGNITGGNLITAGLISTSSITKTGANGVGNIGSSTNYFNTVFAQATSARYADLAEYYLADDIYWPGTVVKFGGDKEITIADRDHDPEIAGVVSTNPAYAMNAALEGEHVLAIALAGRVPCRVRGQVRRGQMMVAAGDGYARAETNPAMGTVIGKALQDFDGEQGVIEIVVGRL